MVSKSEDEKKEILNKVAEKLNNAGGIPAEFSDSIDSLPFRVFDFSDEDKRAILRNFRGKLLDHMEDQDPEIEEMVADLEDY